MENEDQSEIHSVDPAAGPQPSRQNGWSEKKCDEGERRVILNVGGQRFETYASTLASKPETLLGAIFSGGEKETEERADENGEYFFDRDPECFRLILYYYRTGKMCFLPNVPREMLEIEMEFFQISKAKHKKETSSRAFVWGRGDSGQLGIGTRASCGYPMLVPTLKGHNIIQLSLGSSHSAALTDRGEVYTWGNGADGRLGLSNESGKADAMPDVLRPTKVKTLEGVFVKQIDCGEIHTAAVTDKGDLYTWGLGKNGRLGHGNVMTQSIPKKVDHLHAHCVAQVSCGGLHTMALTSAPGSKNRCMTWGCGKYGRLGVGDERDAMIPKRVDVLAERDLANVLCGGHHSMALTEDGAVFSWGYDDDGRLGHGCTGNQFTPKMIESLYGKRVVQIAAGCWHSAAVTKKGVVYTWGSSKSGQLGLPSTLCSFIPRVAFQGGPVRQLSCGIAHTAVVTQKGQVYTWGKNDGGQLGYKTERHDQCTPRRVDSIARDIVISVTCGVHNTAAICR